jgi:hypothetical protein
MAARDAMIEAVSFELKHAWLFSYGGRVWGGGPVEPLQLVGAALSAVVGERAEGIRERIREREDRHGYLVIRFGAAFGVLVALAIVVCGVLVAAGASFISGTEVLEAAVYTVLFSGFTASAYVALGRSRVAPAQLVITTEDRLAAAKAAALLGSEKQQQRLAGALQLEALAQVRPDLVAAAAQALTGLVSNPDTDSDPYQRYVVLAAIQALSRLNSFLREQGLTLDLRLARFAGLDLSRLDLRGADLTGADLTRATLAGTDLTGANLTGVKLDGADLSRADLAYAYLQGASLDHAALAGAHLEGTRMPTTDEALL